MLDRRTTPYPPRDQYGTTRLERGVESLKKAVDLRFQVVPPGGTRQKGRKPAGVFVQVEATYELSRVAIRLAAAEAKETP
jgi:hypothetical protein